MNLEIFDFLKEYSSDVIKINRLFVSAFIILNDLNTKKNILLKEFLVTQNDRDYTEVLAFCKLKKSLSMEELIQLFEFVISPKDKIVTGAIYTPNYIREHIVNDIFQKNEILIEPTVCDPACGCGGFLYTASKKIKEYTNAKYKDIFEKNIFGLDIHSYSITRSKLLLSLLAVAEGEDEYSYEFNLFEGNAFDFKWETKISGFNGFEKIIGNPPYVCSRNIDKKTFKLLDKWEVTKTGHPDLYIPFFQLALENLKENGILGYITVNTFFKSINGRALREYISKNKFSFRIIDFRNEQIFENKTTYTCICFIKKMTSTHIDYCVSSSSSIKNLYENDFSKNYYSDLNNLSGWNLGDIETIKTIKKIESHPVTIFSRFSFSTGIATLKNNIYKFQCVENEDSSLYIFKRKNYIYKVEKKICREIINSNKISTPRKLNNIKEKLIFPYNWNRILHKYEVMSEEKLKDDFPHAYTYLKFNKKELAKRDKGKGQYSQWYEYGRAQGLNISGVKLFLPHITKKPSFVLCNDRKLMFCNGEAIISENEMELKILKKILESKIFWFYIFKTSKPYSSGYFSLGKNYLKGFTIPLFSEEEKRFLLSNVSKDLILKFLLEKYNINEKEIILR